MDNRAFDHAVSFVETWLTLRARYITFPGFAVGIARNGKIVMEKAFGLADVEASKPLRSEHIFRVASHSKMFTATAVMKLAERGALHLDDPAHMHVKWLKKHSDRRMCSVSIRQLLSHSAGIIRDGMEANYWQYALPFPDRNELQRLVLSSRLVFDTNIRMKYSNIGYALLGLVIEAASGHSYSDFVERNIISPLGLRSTGVEFNEQMIPRAVTGYTRPDFDRARAPLPPVDTRALAPATGFYSTVGDMLRFLSAHMAGSGLLLSDESKKEMQKAQWEVPLTQGRKHYGLGFMINTVGDRRVIGHSGGFPGQLTRSCFDHEDRIAVSVMTNSLDAEVDLIADGILESIDFFRRNGHEKHFEAHMEGQFFSLFGIKQSVSVSRERLVCVNPLAWKPFDFMQELRRERENLFRIEKADGYLAAGEPVKFYLSKGKIQRIRYGGSDLLPELAHRRRMEARGKNKTGPKNRTGQKNKK